MYVVVVGMGEVGRHVISVLARDGHDVVAIDQSGEAITRVEDEQDVATLSGFGASPAVLKEAGCAKADLVVAVTDQDEVNLIAALAARQLGARRTIARVQSGQYNEPGQGILYGMLGIDVVMNPRVLLAQEIAKIARSRGALEVLGVAGNRVELVQVELPAVSKMLHKTLANLSLPAETLVAAVVRDGELFVPGGADVLLPGDRAYLIGRTGQMEAVAQSFTGAKAATRLCIVGGGVVGHTLARQLAGSDVEIMLLEKERARAEQLAAELDGVTVICGDGTDLRLLEEEQVGLYDLFASVTADDEVNLMAGLLAKRAGVGQAICLVQRPEYMDIYRQLGIDVVLSPRLVASENILRYVRQTEVQSLTLLEQGQGEVLEMVASAGSRIVGTPISRLHMPRGVLLATIISGEKVTVPSGSDSVHAGDTVILLCLASARQAVERLFRSRDL